METSQQLSTRLEAYLQHLAEINQRWSDWLTLGETGGIMLDRVSLAAFEQQSQSMLDQLQRLADNRAKLLSEAAEAGLPAANVGVLAKSLPIWQRPGVRRAVERARQEMSQLRRMHVAVFILLHQSWQHSRDTLRLFSTGGGQSPVYTATASPDSGGQLLDAAL